MWRSRNEELSCLGLLCLALHSGAALAADRIVVGSKIFTEGYVLGELAAQTMEATRPPVPVVRKLGMGSTGILFQSLNSGAIDVYSDYTGTLAEAILKNPQSEISGGNPRRAAADGHCDLRTTGVRQHLRTGGA